MQKHKKSKQEFVPVDAVDPGTAAKLPDDNELEEVKTEEASAIEASIGLDKDLRSDPEYEEVGVVEIMEVGDTD